MKNEDNTINRLADKRNLYLISQTFNNDYDTYNSAVVAAWTEEEARWIHPCGDRITKKRLLSKNWEDSMLLDEWTHPDNVLIQFIGIAESGVSGVICASYNAG